MIDIDLDVLGGRWSLEFRFVYIQVPIYIQTRRLFWFTYLTDWDTLCDINIYPSNHVGDISNSFESAAQWY